MFKKLIAKKLLIGLALASAFLGLFCMLYFIYITSQYYSISKSDGSSSIDMQATGQIGDFIGGIVGTLWTFSTVLLLYVSLKIQGDEIIEQNKRWERQRIEDIYFKLIDNYNKITFVYPQGARDQPLSNIAINIKNDLMRGSSTDEYKKTITQTAFFPNQDDAVRRIIESLFFIVKFLYESDSEGVLLKHLQTTLPTHEKALLFYYLLAKPYKLKVLPREKYLKSGLVQDADISYDVLRVFAPDLFEPLKPNEVTPIL